MTDDPYRTPVTQEEWRTLIRTCYRALVMIVRKMSEMIERWEEE
jgi:hypothetical protein